MKKTIILFMCVISTLSLKAQDLIILRTAEEIQAKVSAITPEYITYKRWSNPDGPTYTISKSDVFYIKYQNGEKEVMQNTNFSSSQTKHYSSSAPIKFQGYANIGTIFYADGAGPTLDVNLGAKIYDYFYAGLETGFHSILTPYYYEYGNYWSEGVIFEGYIPLGVNMKGYITKDRKVNPYVNCSLGGFFGIADLGGVNGFFCQAGMGIDIKRFSLGIGYSGLVKYSTFHSGYFKLGIRFGK